MNINMCEKICACADSDALNTAKLNQFAYNLHNNDLLLQAVMVMDNKNYVAYF